MKTLILIHLIIVVWFIFLAPAKKPAQKPPVVRTLVVCPNCGGKKYEYQCPMCCGSGRLLKEN